VNLPTLPVISRNGITQPVASSPTPQAPVSVVEKTNAPQTHQNAEPLSASCTTFSVGGSQTPSSSGSGSIIETLERLGALRDKGYVSEEEFATKKAELLNRL
jgi:hypothetical protein